MVADIAKRNFEKNNTVHVSSFGFGSELGYTFNSLGGDFRARPKIGPSLSSLPVFRPPTTQPIRTVDGINIARSFGAR